MQRKKRQRRIVEIYFVLYLAALIFILPKGSNNSTINELSFSVPPSPLSLQVDKTTIFCRIESDSSGYHIVEMDSINTIFYAGDIENLRFEFFIEGKLSGQSVKISSENISASRFFRLEDRPELSAAVFSWTPPPMLIASGINQSYLVHIIAEGKLKDNKNIKDYKDKSDGKEDQSGFFKAKTEFSINIINIGAEYPNQVKSTPDLIAQNLAMNSLNNIPSNFIYNPEKFDLIPESQSINAIATQTWTNTLTASYINLKRDLASEPEIIIELKPDGNGGEAYIKDISEDRVMIAGKTPSYGKMRVGVKIIRASDKQEKIKYFDVFPQAIEQPSFPTIMYPGTTYFIDPKVPLLGKDLKAYLKDGKSIVAQSNQAAKFSYTPNISDTGKTLILERYIDNSLFGQVYKLRISSFPEPEIIDIQRHSSKEIEIITKSYGVFYDEKNEIIDIEISGNAKSQDLRGRIRDERDPISRTQHFLLSPINSDNPFNFQIFVKDRYDKRSKTKTFKED